MKLLASDYDGTLRYGQDVMAEDLEAIQRWKEAGFLFAIVTGRSYESILKQIQQYNIPCDYVVSNNGGMVFDPEGTILSSNYLDYVTSLDIMYVAKEVEGVCSYVVNDGVYRHRVVVNADLEDKRYPNLQQDLSEEEVMDLGKYAQIVISMTEPSLAVSLAEQINMHFAETVVAYANNYVVDVVPKGTSKASGLDFVCEYAELTEDDVYTIGDSYNDIPLMEYGKHGAAMSTSVEEVKDHALFHYDSLCQMIDTLLK